MSIDLSVDVSGVESFKQFNTELDKVKTKLNEVEKATPGADSGFQKMGSTILKLAGTVGVLYSISKAVSVVKSAMDFAGELDRLSAKLGITTKALQQLGYAAKQMDVEPTALYEGLSKLSIASVESADKFKELGISLTDASGKMKPAEVLIDDVAEVLRNTEDPAKRVSIAMDVFGKSGADLVPMLINGKKGLDEYRQAALDLGIVLDEELIAKSDELEKKMNTLTDIMRVNLYKAILDNAGAFDTLSKALIKASEHTTAIATVFSVLVGAAGITLVVGAVGSLVTAYGALATAATAATTALSGLAIPTIGLLAPFVALAAAIAAVGYASYKITSEIIEHWEGIKAWFSSISWASMTARLSSAWQTTVNTLKNAWKTFTNVILNTSWGDIFGAVRRAWDATLAYIKKGWIATKNWMAGGVSGGGNSYTPQKEGEVLGPPKPPPPPDKPPGNGSSGKGKQSDWVEGYVSEEIFQWQQEAAILEWSNDILLEQLQRKVNIQNTYKPLLDSVSKALSEVLSEESERQSEIRQQTLASDKYFYELAIKNKEDYLALTGSITEKYASPEDKTKADLQAKQDALINEASSIAQPMEWLSPEEQTAQMMALDAIKEKLIELQVEYDNLVTKSFTWTEATKMMSDGLKASFESGIGAAYDSMVTQMIAVNNLQKIQGKLMLINAQKAGSAAILAIGKEAGIKTLWEIAEGIADTAAALTPGGEPAAAAANVHFMAAAKYAAIGAIATTAGVAMGKGASGSSSGGGSGKGGGGSGGGGGDNNKPDKKDPFNMPDITLNFVVPPDEQMRNEVGEWLSDTIHDIWNREGKN